MNTKEKITNWFFKDENAKYKSDELDKDGLKKAHAACLKDLKLSIDVVKPEYFRYIWREVCKGTLKPKTHLQVDIVPEVAVADIHIEHWRPGQEKFDKNLFIPFKTGKGIDIILSDDGGPMKGTSYIVIGEAGVGKTTVLSDVQRCLQNNYKKAKIACVQSEMKKIDLGYEYTKKPWMEDLEYVILKDYGYENIKNVLKKIFSDGYDILFVDSFEDIVGKLKIFADMSEGEAENFLLGLMDRANDSKDNHGVHTCVFAIQQITKGGEYKGSTRLKHMTTGMVELRKDARGNRYILFSKNRRGGKHVDKRMYYSLDTETNEVVYDVQLFAESEEQAAMVNNEKKKIKEASANFFEVFGKTKVNIDEEETVEE
jgi:hypothetical protein